MTPTARQVRLDPRAPLVLDTHELGRRPGTLRAVARTVAAPADLLNGVIGIEAGTALSLQVRLEAVMEGVLVTGTVTGTATGECVRCLDPVADRLEVDLQELFLHEPPEDADADNESPLLEGDLLDLEPTVRDAVVPALPFQPVCRPDCPGLRDRCGARLLDDPDHGHVDEDPRWAVLAGLTDRLAEVPDGTGPDATDATEAADATVATDVQTYENDGTATPAGPHRTEEETN